MKKNRYASHDFSFSSLPSKRSEVFKDVYHTRFSTIVRCGLVLLLFALPLVASVIVLDVSRFGTNGYTSSQLEGFYFYYNIFLNVAILLFLFVFLIGLSGVMRILKLLIWGEGIDFWYDFRQGVKENYKVMLPGSIIYAIIYALYFTVLTVFTEGILTYVSLAFFLLLFTPIYFWYLFLGNMYNAKAKEFINNSLFCFGKSIFWSLLFVVLACWPFFYEYFQIPFSILTFLLKSLFIILLVVFYYPCLLIAGLLYSCSVFDQYINEQNFPEYYRKGLFNPNDIVNNDDEYYNL